MGIRNNRWLTLIALMMVLFVATACFQQVGDQAQGQQVSLIVSPTDTDTPEPIEEPTDFPTERATAGDSLISDNATDTPTPTETATLTITPFVVAQAGDEGGVLQPTDQPDDFSLQATQLVIDATNTAVAPTTQAAATLFGATDTPIPTNPPIDNTTGLTTSIQPGADCVHEVRAGETLFALSQYYGIPVNDIATRNGIVNINLISLGQRLTISGCGTNNVVPPPTSTPSPTPTPFQLQGSVGIGGSDLGQGGGAVVNPDGSVATVGINCQRQYTVQQYDNLFQLSITYGVSVQSIAAANGLTNINRIDMGQVLCIPTQ